MTSADPGESTWCCKPDLVIYSGCGGLDIVRVGGVDTDGYYLYDPATSALVGTRLYGNGQMSCQGVSTSVFLPTAFASAIPDCPSGSISDLPACANTRGCADAPVDEERGD